MTVVVLVFMSHSANGADVNNTWYKWGTTQWNQ